MNNNFNNVREQAFKCFLKREYRIAQSILKKVDLSLITPEERVLVYLDRLAILKQSAELNDRLEFYKLFGEFFSNIQYFTKGEGIALRLLILSAGEDFATNQGEVEDNIIIASDYCTDQNSILTAIVTYYLAFLSECNGDNEYMYNALEYTIDSDWVKACLANVPNNLSLFWLVTIVGRFGEALNMNGESSLWVGEFLDNLSLEQKQAFRSQIELYKDSITIAKQGFVANFEELKKYLQINKHTLL